MKFSSALGKVSQAALLASQFVLQGVQPTEQLLTLVQVSPWQLPLQREQLISGYLSGPSVHRALRRVDGRRTTPRRRRRRR